LRWQHSKNPVVAGKFTKIPLRGGDLLRNYCRVHAKFT
jgi:hypothetical protein